MRDLTGEGIGAHGEVFVDGDGSQVCCSDAGDFGGLLHGGVSLGGAVGDDLAVASFGVAGVVGGAFASGKKSAEGGTGRGVLDDAATG